MDGLKYPQNWGRDKLSKFLNNTFINTFATFEEPPFKKYYELVSSVNELFYKVRDAYDFAKPEGPTLLFLQSHSCFLAAVRLIISGQLIDSWPVLRACIESALYGYEVYINPPHWEKYCNRDKGQQKLEECLNIFQAENILKSYRSDLKKLEKLYYKSLTEGAHPNIRGLKRRVQIRITNGKHERFVKYLFGELNEYKSELLSCRNIGLEVLKLIFKVYKDKLIELGFNRLLESEIKKNI
jgi:hypothetical protein